MYDDPHVSRPGGLVHSYYPGKKDFRAPGLPLSLDGAMPMPGNADVPALGQHTNEVLTALRQQESE
jgi:crotonobetainyl-CoA:carnitine CoA-transferase CaiB-like acyl-CoA transferase